MHQIGAAKAFGREVRGFKQNVWDETVLLLSLPTNMAKFSQHEELKRFYSPQKRTCSS